MEISFERFEDGKWYVVFPEYDGPQEDLEMVDGADKMLDALTADGMYVTLDVYLEEPSSNDFFTLEQEAHDEDGSFYNVKDCKQYSGTVWLCNVVHEFFGNHPERIYCKILD